MTIPLPFFFLSRSLPHKVRVWIAARQRRACVRALDDLTEALRSIGEPYTPPRWVRVLLWYVRLFGPF